MFATRPSTIALPLVVLCCLLGGSANADLIGYWNFDGALTNQAGGTIGALQFAGDAALSTTQVAPGNGGSHSLQVDGTGDYAFLDAAAGKDDVYTALGDSFTISMWGRSDVAASASGESMRYFWDIGASHGAGAGVFFNATHSISANGQIGAYHNSGGISSGVTGAADTWYHVALTGDGSTERMYVDGNLVGSKSQGPAFSGGNDLRFGCEAKAVNREWTGYLDDVAIWSGTQSAAAIAQLAAGADPTTMPPLVPTWVFEDETFDNSGGSTAVGPTKNGARWRYKHNSTATDHVYADKQISDFADFAYYDTAGSEWQPNSSLNYPQVRVSDQSLHPGHSATETYQDTVIAWEADFSGFVDVDIEATGGAAYGYQVLKWDDSAGQMQVLRQRQTQSGNLSPFQVSTRVESGDQILYVVDNDGSLGGDRIYQQETVTVSEGPQMHDYWRASEDEFNDTSLVDAAGPWRNSARWRYMASAEGPTHVYTSISEFTDFTEFYNSAWQDVTGTTGYPSINIGNNTMHPGPGPAVLVWEADFGGDVAYEFDLSQNSSIATTSYQLLMWDASEGLMSVLETRQDFDPATPVALMGGARMAIGDMLLFVLDNRTGSYGSDRVAFNATITLVPEPSTLILALLGPGLLLLCFGRRRKR